MARVKRGKTTRARHKSLMQKAKGFRHGRKNVYKQAKQAVDKAVDHAYKGRKIKKRYFRSIWIIRLNAALGKHGLKYSQFIKALSKSETAINRKELSEMAVNEPAKFEKLLVKLDLKSPASKTK